MNHRDILCRCGHSRQKHYFNDFHDYVTKDTCMVCSCGRYCADNLITIEMYARQKGLV